MYEWTNDLVLGNDLIDSQHKQIIQYASEIHKALKVGKGKEHIEEQIAFLGRYIQEHFLEEENLHQLYGFPEANAHKTEHQLFTKQIAEFEKDYCNKGSTSSLTLKINKSLYSWFQEHIRHSDRVFIEFMNGR